MFRNLNPRFPLPTCALLGVALSLLGTSVASAIPLNFGLVNPTTPVAAESRLTMTVNATLNGVATTSTPQVAAVASGSQAGKGSLTTTYQDTSTTDSKVLVDMSHNWITFTGGSTAVANNTARNNGTAYQLKPGIGGASGTAPGNYGLLIQAPQDVAVPPIDIGTLIPGVTLNLGTLTALNVTAAFRNVVLDVTSSGELALAPASLSYPQTFDPTGLNVIVSGTSDVLVSATFKQASATDTIVIAAALTALAPTLANSGIVLTNSYTLFPSPTVSIGYATTTAIPATPLSNSAAVGNGIVEHIGANLRLTTPVNVTLPLSNVPFVTGTVALSGQLIGQTPFVDVPEPSTMVLAALAVGALVMRRRRPTL